MQKKQADSWGQNHYEEVEGVTKHPFHTDPISNLFCECDALDLQGIKALLR